MDASKTRRRVSRSPADNTRSAATQPYRTTDHAQRIACRLTVIDNGHRITLRPLADVLTSKTRATLAAIERRNGGRSHGR
jgi:hypothetical protein